MAAIGRRFEAGQTTAANLLRRHAPTLDADRQAKAY
jgi:hypothetical protein